MCFAFVMGDIVSINFKAKFFFWIAVCTLCRLQKTPDDCAVVQYCLRIDSIVGGKCVETQLYTAVFHLQQAEFLRLVYFTFARLELTWTKLRVRREHASKMNIYLAERI
jgi:hypothetical protein